MAGRHHSVPPRRVFSTSGPAQRPVPLGSIFNTQRRHWPAQPSLIGFGASPHGRSRIPATRQGHPGPGPRRLDCPRPIPAHHPAGGAGLPPRGRLSTGHLYPADRLVEATGGPIRPDEADLDRQDRRGAGSVDRDHHQPGQPRQARALPGDLGPPEPGRGTDPGAGPGAGQGGKGRGLDRRRAPRHRGARCSPADGARLADGESERRWRPSGFWTT